MRVLLGPAHELHVGVHGSLLAAPPPCVEYVQSTYALRFRPDPVGRAGRPPFSPLHDPAVSESVRFDLPAGVAVVHSSRLPVEGGVPWVVDADSLLAPLQIGRFLALGRAFRNEPFDDPEPVIRRERAMLDRYLSPLCTAVLLRTEYARRELLGHLADRGHDPVAVERLAAKTRVMYPTVAPIGGIGRRSPVVTVLYMGRTGADKGAAVAAATFGRLRATCPEPFRAMFVGPCPPADRAALAAAEVETYPLLSRADYLDLLAGCDIFFSPTEFESFGMGLVEAIAAGTAIVCSTGPGMEHIGELLRPGHNALLVSNALNPARRVGEFAAAIAALITDPPLRHQLAANNRALATVGALSIGRRDQLLLAAYEQASIAQSRQSTEDDSVFEWREDICHWMNQRYATPDGIRVRG
jgi:hypothetical protein